MSIRSRPSRQRPQYRQTLRRDAVQLLLQARPDPQHGRGRAAQVLDLRLFACPPVLKGVPGGCVGDYLGGNCVQPHDTPVEDLLLDTVRGELEQKREGNVFHVYGQFLAVLFTGSLDDRIPLRVQMLMCEKGVSNILTDVVYVVAPIIYLSTIQLPRRTQWALRVVFWIGLV
jgi:hypothetical protein